MPEPYNKIAEGIVKGNVPMVASFVERYVSDDEPGFFTGDREHVEGDIRVHVTVFGYLEHPDSHVTDSLQLGVVDLQQLPDGRVWMVVGVLPTVVNGEAWLNDVYSAMVRRMAARLVQFGFLDAPNRPRLKSASMTLTQVAQALTSPKPAPAPEPIRPTPPPATSAPTAPAAEPLQPPKPVEPIAQAAPVTPAPTPVARPAPAPVPLTAPSPASSAPGLFNPAGGQRLDLVLTGVMLVIWVLACGVLFYLLTLLVPK